MTDTVEGVDAWWQGQLRLVKNTMSPPRMRCVSE